MSLRLPICIILLFGGGINCQSDLIKLSNLRTKNLTVVYPLQELDSLTIIPGSLQIFQAGSQTAIDTFAYQLDNNRVLWQRPIEELPKTIRVNYRVFPFNIEAPIGRFETEDRNTAADEKVIGFEYDPYENQGPLINFKGLNYNGSFARGVSFGNNQDLVLNSSFNLQLSGNLGEDVEILAAITDENIPIQPEGNTQQLREFDRIFIQLKKDNNLFIAGDYELRRPNSYFMNYFKKLQGATYANSVKVLEGKGTINTSASVAISRGKFARNNVIQQEGNQGPYRLEGNEGERFIIVLAGTEKVFLDGTLLKRGIEEDYIIDYNRGEISFTNQQLITKDSRIIVEFEYSEQNFNRTLYALNTEFIQKGLRVYANVYNEQDSKNTSGNQVLTDEQKAQLSAAGDQFQNRFVSSIRSLEEDFDELRPTYQLLDSISSCGEVDSVLVFNSNPEVGILTARFTFVGQGNGNYVLDNSQRANERIYKWVAPDSINCFPRGDYEPVIQLSAPKRKQMVTIGTDYSFNKERTNVSLELALSQNDLNRFSLLDGEDDEGWAVYGNARNILPLSKDNENWSFETELQYELKQQHFAQLNPYRPAEFLRDWNLTNIQGIGNTENANESIVRTDFTIRNKQFGFLSHSFHSFVRDSIYSGLKNVTNLAFKPKGWDILLVYDVVTSQGIDQKNTFARPKFNIAKKFEDWGGWKIGIIGEREKSTRKNLNSNSLITSSFFFDRYQWFLESPQSKASKFGVTYNQRVDYQPEGSRFLRNAKAEEFNLNGQWKPGKFWSMKGNVTLRNLEVNPDANLTAETGQTILGRSDINANFAKGAIRMVNTYEIGSGQEPRIEFTFVRVAQGQGTHVWLDSLFNNDGIIQPNEMEIAPFPDIADFIRINTFTNEFIRTNNVSFNQSIQLNPKAIWMAKKGFKKLVSRFSTQSTVKIVRKTRQGDGIAAWNPFQLSITDSLLVAISSNIRNILFFNRGNASYDIQVGQRDNRNKFVQTSGFESRQLSEQFLKCRVNLSSIVSADLDLGTGKRVSDSEFFDSRDYDINFTRVAPEVSFLPNKSLRFSFQYKNQIDENKLPGSNERASQNDLNFEIAYNKSSKTTIRGRFSWVQVDFRGEPNSPVGFAILNGLQDGRNLLWNISLDQQLAKNIRLNISYDGRKTGQNNIIHVGRAQVAAVF